MTVKRAEDEDLVMEFYTDGTYTFYRNGHKNGITQAHWKYENDRLYFRYDGNITWVPWANSIALKVIETLKEIDNILVGDDDGRGILYK